MKAEDVKQAKDLAESGKRFLEASRRQVERSANNKHTLTSKELDDFAMDYYKAGIQKVVDWIEKQGSDTGKVHAIYSFLGVDWQAQLKKWGVK